MPFYCPSLHLDPKAQAVMSVHVTAVLCKLVEQCIILIFPKCTEAYWWDCFIYCTSLMAGTLLYKRKCQVTVWDYGAPRKHGCNEGWIINLFNGFYGFTVTVSFLYLTSCNILHSSFFSHCPAYIQYNKHSLWNYRPHSVGASSAHIVTD